MRFEQHGGTERRMHDTDMVAVGTENYRQGDCNIFNALNADHNGQSN